MGLGGGRKEGGWRREKEESVWEPSELPHHSTLGGPDLLSPAALVSAAQVTPWRTVGPTLSEVTD